MSSSENSKHHIFFGVNIKCEETEINMAQKNEDLSEFQRNNQQKIEVRICFRTF
jgi:hypothetical protein